jgi:hypothetical protein
MGSHRNGWEVTSNGWEVAASGTASGWEVAASGWQVAAAEPPGRRLGLVERIWSSRPVNVQVKASRQSRSQDRKPTQVTAWRPQAVVAVARRAPP